MSDSNHLDKGRDGGQWLAAARGWMQRKKRNGEHVTWGSGVALDPPITAREVEELAAEVAEDALRDRDEALEQLEKARANRLRSEVALTSRAEKAEALLSSEQAHVAGLQRKLALAERNLNALKCAPCDCMPFQMERDVARAERDELRIVVTRSMGVFNDLDGIIVPDEPSQLENAIKTLGRQRDELREALRKIADPEDHADDRPRAIARAALAKVGGGA